jgi:hypothetical protein
LTGLTRAGLETVHAPAREIGHEDRGLGAEVQLRAAQQKPGTAHRSPEIERGTKLRTELRRGPGVAQRRTPAQLQLAVDDLGDHVRGRLEHVAVRCDRTSCAGHGRKT